MYLKNQIHDRLSGGEAQPAELLGKTLAEAFGSPVGRLHHRMQGHSPEYLRHAREPAETAAKSIYYDRNLSYLSQWLNPRANN